MGTPIPKRILVIDDEEILTKTFTLLLKRQGYDVLTAKGFQEAQTLTTDNHFDLLICDIRMPGMNGVETIRSLRTGEGVRPASHPAETPVIFMTGYADEKMEAEARTLNPLAVIYKPFDTLEVLKLVRTSLG